MSDSIPCAFEGHSCRSRTCQGTATTFFRTAKKTLWPLCDNCNDRHKIVGADLIRKRHVAHKVVDATFDIPIEDSREEFEAQDPDRVGVTIRVADAMLG